MADVIEFISGNAASGLSVFLVSSSIKLAALKIKAGKLRRQAVRGGTPDI